MSVGWTSPAALWLLALIPFGWIALRFARTNFNPRQRVAQVITRSLVLALVVLALARPVVTGGSSRLSIVYLVDVSHSIAEPEIAAAAAKIDELNRRIAPAHSRTVVFGKDAAVVDDLRGQFAVDRTGTDLEAALLFARATLAPGFLPRIVLFSDGRATAGDITDAVARLHADGVQVSVIPLGQPAIGDTWIDGIDVPDRLSAGATFAATLHVSSQRAGRGSVDVRTGGRVLASRDVALGVGSTDVIIDVKLADAGAQAIEGVVTLADDPVRSNDRLTRSVMVAPRPRVLYLEGGPGDSAKYLAGALTAAGIDVGIRPGNAWQHGIEPLDPWDVVILSDVPRAMLPDAAMRTLAGWVETQGGGLLVAGGEAVFGEGPQGYRKTELERLTPVTFERRDEPEIALVIVLDKSYSMNGPVMELCKGAAQAAIDALADEQSVGVITFNDKFGWDVTLRNVGQNRDAIRKAVSAIEASGSTMIYPPLEQAFLALKGVKARAKHVVLLSDGRSYPDDFEGLTKRMVDAKITVSSIAVGQAADTELLANIAKWGRGRSYAVDDARDVPQIFVKEAKDVPNLAFDEKTLAPVVKHQGFLEGVDLARAPALRGRTATVIKDSALELVSTRDGDPLLAFWQIGLGRAAVFASDVKDRWASDWVTWRGYGPFFSSAVRALERQRPAPIALRIDPGVVRGTTRALTLSIEARDAEGRPRDFLSPRLSVQSGSKPPVGMPARQTAPGHYETRVIVDAADALAASVAGEGPLASALIVPDANAEYRFRPADEPALRSIADATGGRWMPTSESIATTQGERRATRRPVWPWLLWSALGVWLGDLLLRRVRIFEKA